MKIAVAVLALVLTSQAFASDIVSSKITVKRGGQSSVRVSYPFWSGEYPGPVLDVGSRLKNKTTTIVAYKSLRDKSGKSSCEIKNGLYHPWAKEKASARNFYSLTGLEEYVAETDLTLEASSGTATEETLKVKKGAKITEVINFGEGLQGAVLEQDGKRIPIEFFFSVLEDTKGLKQITAPGEFHEQWIRVTCANGEKVFASAEEMLATKGVREGEITGYGSVGPAKP